MPDQVWDAQLAASLTPMQEIGGSLFAIQDQARFNLTHDDGMDYCGAAMSYKGTSSLFGSSFASNCVVPMWGLNPESSGKNGQTTLGEGDSLELHLFSRVTTTDLIS